MGPTISKQPIGYCPSSSVIAGAAVAVAILAYSESSTDRVESPAAGTGVNGGTGVTMVLLTMMSMALTWLANRCARIEILGRRQ